MISLTVNGKPHTLDGETPLPQFLRSLSVDVRLIAVAINGEVVPKNQHRETVLRDGDVVEIVRMVGGGGSKLEARGSKFELTPPRTSGARSPRG